MVKKQAKQAAGAACIAISLDPEAFAREQFPGLDRMAKSFARYEEYAHSRKYDAEEIAAAALPLLYERGYRAFAETFPGRKAQVNPKRHNRRMWRAIKLAALGGDIGTGTPLDADLAARRQGYRAVRPQNARAFAEVYGLAKCAVSDPIGIDDLSGPFRRLALALTETERTWLFSRFRGVNLVQAARTAGKDGTDRACEAWSLRTRAAIARKARKCGIDEFYGTRRRQFARPLPTAMPEDEDAWIAREFQKTAEIPRGI